MHQPRDAFARRACNFALLFVGVTFAFTSSLAATAAAQALYYRSIPIGERAMGLGGAFTGVASDPSATYYNPGGMMRGGRFELLGSFSSIVLSRKKVINAFAAPENEVTFTSSRVSTLPRFVGTIAKLGPKRFGGDHRFALGYSTLESARDELGSAITRVNVNSSLDLRMSRTYRSRWYGASFAAQLTAKSALGFSIFASDQSLIYGEDIGFAAGGTLGDDGVRVGGSSATTSGSATVRAWHLVPRLGWIHRVSSQWQVGVMVQTPGIPLSQKGDVFRRVNTDASPNDPTYFLLDVQDLQAKAPIPFEVRAGVGWQVKTDTLVSLDVSLTGPVKSHAVLQQPQQLSDLGIGLGVYLARSTARRWTPNLAIGAEHRFGKVVVAGGFFTNVSSAPDVPETSTVYTPDQVNLWGLAVSVGVDTKGYRLSLGASGLFGKGEALTANFDERLVPGSYTRTEARRSALVLYIAGAVAVATKTAKRVGDKRKEKKDQGKPTDEVGDVEQGADEPAPSDAP